MDQRLQHMSNDAAGAASGATPRRARLAIFGGVIAVLLGALYLMSVRGEALLLDLSQLAGRVWCF